MVTTAHLLTGASIGYLAGDIYLAAVIAFMVHYILDAVPHACWSPVKNYKKAGWRGMDKIDLLKKSIEPMIGLAIVIYFVTIIPSHLVLPVLAGAFFGWLPDAFVFLEWGLGIKRLGPIRTFELKYHRHMNNIRGVVPQLFICGLALTYMFGVAK